MFDLEKIKSIQKYYRSIAVHAEEDRQEHAATFSTVADMLDLAQADPYALYLLFDSGIFNDIVKGYAVDAARRAGLSDSEVHEIRAGVRSSLDMIDSCQAEKVGKE